MTCGSNTLSVQPAVAHPVSWSSAPAAVGVLLVRLYTAALALTSSMYRVVPIAPVESDGATVVSRCPAQFRTRAGASTAAARPGGGGRPARSAAAALAAAFWAAYTAGSGTRSGTARAVPGTRSAGAGWLTRSTGRGTV